MTTQNPHPFWTIEGLRAAAGGRFLSNTELTNELAESPIEGISIDSRSIKPGEAFLVIKGDNFDGADFIDAAIDKGANLIIGAESVGERAVPVIAVEDVIIALARLAATWRDCMHTTQVIGVTGTNGKTTTANLIHAACSGARTGSVSERSFNNHIGAPLTILRAQESDDYLVCEIGTSAPGEIDHLANILRPDIGVITSIGLGHAESLGDLDGVRVEKGALLRALGPEGVAIIPASERALLAYVEARTVITFGSEIDADLIAGPVTVEARQANDDSETIGVTFTIGGERVIHLPLLGSHNARNAVAAIAVAEQLEVSRPGAIAGLANVVIPQMRLEMRTIAGIRVINDAYNANPDSMACAIDTAITIPRTGRLVLILGDMLELGEHAKTAHRRIGELIAGLQTPTSLVTLGTDSRLIADECLRAPMVETTDALADWSDKSIERAVSLLMPGDTVLLKASRGVQLERIIDRLIEQELDPTAAHHSSNAG